MSAHRCRVRCGGCGWRGVRTSVECECYDEWRLYCRPGSPGPGCPSGVVWRCPRCEQRRVRFIDYVKSRPPTVDA